MHLISSLHITQDHFSLKSTNFYNIEKHVKRSLILKVNYEFCVHIIDFGPIAYQEYWLFALLKQKLIK